MHEKSKPSAPCRAQVADNLPLYGVCCYMEEIVHRPPTVLRGGRAPSAPLSRYMVSAPRCYCFLTHQPFFSLHFKVCATASSPTSPPSARTSSCAALLLLPHPPALLQPALQGVCYCFLTHQPFFSLQFKVGAAASSPTSLLSARASRWAGFKRFLHTRQGYHGPDDEADHSST